MKTKLRGSKIHMIFKDEQLRDDLFYNSEIAYDLMIFKIMEQPKITFADLLGYIEQKEQEPEIGTLGLLINEFYEIYNEVLENLF